MAKVSEMFPSKWLKAQDIDQDYEVEIVDVTIDDIGQGDQKEKKFVVHFQEFDKGLVLNKVNASMIEAQHGDDTDNWIGKKVVLTVEDVAYQGKIVPAIRVRRPARPVAPARKPMPASKPAQRPASRPTSEQAAADANADEATPF